MNTAFNRKISVLVFLLFAALSFLQSCESDDNNAATGFNGIVTSAGKPAADALVSLDGDKGKYATKSDTDGRFQMDNVVAGEYVLTVKAEHDNGTFFQYQREISVTGGDQSLETIELPEGVTLFQPDDVTASSVELKWNRSSIPNFLEYKLYRHSTSGLDETTGTLIHVATSVNDTVFTDTGVSDNETYYYRVFVRNTLGLYGGSNIVEVGTTQGNYVVNGDFELDLSGWELYTPDPCVTIVDDPTSPAGGKVLKADMATMPMVNISSEILQSISQDKLIAGKTYTLSFWVKVEDITGSGYLSIYLQNSVNFSVPVAKNIDNTVGTAWNHYNVDFIAPTATAPYNLFIFAVPDVPWDDAHRFKAYIDGIELYRK